nr:MAG TPA: hypothetical protein [Caudoviricetes sp.]
MCYVKGLRHCSHLEICYVNVVVIVLRHHGSVNRGKSS